MKEKISRLLTIISLKKDHILINKVEQTMTEIMND